MESNRGSIHLIPVPLSGSDTGYLAKEAIEVAQNINHFMVENAKSARNFLKSINHPIPLQQIEVETISENNKQNWLWVKEKAKLGLNVGILSEAGLPAVADPGSEIIKSAHFDGYKVVTHSGPNSMIMALMASGMNGQRFIFHGYLPAKKEELREKLITIIKNMAKSDYTNIFMETPYRNKQVLEMLINNVPQHFLLSLSNNLHTANEVNICMSIQKWKLQDINKYINAPTIFCLSKI
ncbi:MAG TPA: SAM-dependent methyltransferase [Saprospiraceae bacterium]|nr:SAM-dependent methyltransferase [Saprospiraceae bacterium]